MAAIAATARVVHLAAAPERPSITMTATLGEMTAWRACCNAPAWHRATPRKYPA
jgi:hypothetical protein